MDNFEKHIRDHADQFNERRADKDKMWAKISEELHQAKPKVIPLWKRPLFRVAASVLLLLGVASFFGLSVLNNNAEKAQYASKELMEIDMYYKDLVSYQVELVKNNKALSEDNKAEFLSFINELDAEYEVLKEEMQKNLDNELVLEAIVSNYKKRIELIENLLHLLNESKKQDEDDHAYTL